MTSTVLTSKEKSELTSLARGMIEQAKKINEEQSSPKEKDVKGPFDGETIFYRLSELEKRFELHNLRVEKTVDTTLHALERLEACVSRMEGEISGLKSDNRKLNESVKRGLDNERSELLSAAEQFSSIVATRISELIERIEAIEIKRRGNFEVASD